MEQKNYRLSASIVVTAPKGFSHPVMEELWQGYAFGGAIEFRVGEENTLSIGHATFTPLASDEEYTVTVTEEGCGILAQDKRSLARGFCTLMLNLEATDPASGSVALIRCGILRGAFHIARRMIHLCAFPETPFRYFRKLMRLSAILQYTHVVFEPWGMLRYDCDPALSWDCAYSKEQVREVIDEVRALGVEVIPMFNHLGHASSCRDLNGKHVVLDRYPTYAHMFSPDGWAWNPRSQAARTLLRRVREELYELVGEGEYFHLGCDEAHIYSRGYLPHGELAGYLGDITREVIAEGRTPIVWGDMMLDKNGYDPAAKYYADADDEATAGVLLSALAEGTVVADWQYDATEMPFKTSLHLRDLGHPVAVCPWYALSNIDAAAATARLAGMHSFMLTTWHTLSGYMGSILYGARVCGLPATSWSSASTIRMETATLWRKLMLPSGCYEDSGFSAAQIQPIPGAPRTHGAYGTE